MFKSNFFSKNKKFCSALVISFLQHNSLIHKVWVDLINERLHKIQGFLVKIREFRGINLTRWQSVLPENYNYYLNPTELIDLCCSVVQFISLDCGSIAVV